MNCFQVIKYFFSLQHAMNEEAANSPYFSSSTISSPPRGPYFLSLSLFLYPLINISLYLFLCPSLYIFPHSISLSINLSVSLSISLSLSDLLSLYIYICIYLTLFITPSRSRSRPLAPSNSSHLPQ